MVERPNIHWDDVAGLGEAKRNLVQAVILPMKLPQFFTGPRTPWRGILLYGPPGTGKSFLAKACATEAEGSAFLTVSTSDLVSKWLGESEKLIRALFETARAEKKAIIFIDEIDSLLSERTENDSEAARRIKTEFLIQMDGVGKSMDGILLLAATNVPWGLDPAVRRRFEKKIYIPLPDKEARLALLKLKTKGMDSSLTPQELDRIADVTEGYSGADCSILCRDAAMAPVNAIQQAQYFCEWEGKLWPCHPDGPGAVKTTVLEMPPDQLARLQPPPLSFRDFQIALHKVRPSVAQGDLKRFQDWTAEFGEEGN
jgi:vacuolar protein-sorting-associated protein 4